jgi:hypothetical protein
MSMLSQQVLWLLLSGIDSAKLLDPNGSLEQGRYLNSGELGVWRFAPTK